MLPTGMIGDIENTGRAYARACYDVRGETVVTVNPLYGEDGVRPFLRRGRTVVIPVSFAWGDALAEAVIDWTYRLSLEHPPGMIRLRVEGDSAALSPATRVQMTALGVGDIQF